MPRKSKTSGKPNRGSSWKSLHHRIDFSPNDEADIVQWCKGEDFDLTKHISTVLGRMWSFKISPMDEGEKVYCTVQSKDPDDEWGDHSFGFIWSNSIGSLAVICYVCMVLAERGDLYKQVPMTMTDVLDFLS